jgi:hypothetical protein
MTEAKSSPSESAIKGDVAKKVAKETEQGYVGVVTDPTPNEAYSLETGPDSPPIVEDDRTPVTQTHSRDAKAKEKS